MPYLVHHLTGWTTCDPTSTNFVPAVQSVNHFARPDGQGGTVIEYNMDRPGNVQLTIYTLMGQKVKTLVNEYQSSGPHQALYFSKYHGLRTIPLVYELLIGNKKYSGKFIINS